ncbi:Alpha/Beta hydrolase protein [Hypoxylon rubiginosum]|uniref:Alpha/Beta hydrolase protein n=1 Tax=Hypoxylon rubiginosum TaxID=110542 RepID=A0ACC0CJB7_9PEZI|nr:Alpha/Beta hydrolase protein [Hypoxylon rubiginosum]
MSMMTRDLFVAELDNLVDYLQLRELGFFVLGQGRGGILAGAYASRRPKGLRKLIIAGGPVGMPLYSEGCKHLSQLPPGVRYTVERYERKGDCDSEEFQKANAAFFARHSYKLDPLPDPAKAVFDHLREDLTLSHYGLTGLFRRGTFKFIIVGSFKDWEPWKEAHNIQVETLLFNGDRAEVMGRCIELWLKSIAKVKWVTLSNTSRMAHWE